MNLYNLSQSTNAFLFPSTSENNNKLNHVFQKITKLEVWDGKQEKNAGFKFPFSNSKMELDFQGRNQ